MLDWIKAHPYLAGALTLGLVFVFIMVRRAASGSTASTATATGSTYDPTLAQAQLASGAQLQALSIQAQTSVDTLNAQVNVAQLNDAMQLAMAQLNQQVQLQDIFSKQQVSDATIAATQQTQDQTISAQLTLGLAQLQASGTPAPLPAPVGTPAPVLAPGTVTSAPAPVVSGNTAAPAIQAVQNNTIAAALSAPPPSPSSTVSCGAGMHFESGACIYDAPDTTSVDAQWQVTQANDAIWNAAAMSSCIPSWWVALNGNPNGSPVC